MKYEIFYADGQLKSGDVDLSDDELQALCRSVIGGYLEFVTVYWGERYRTMVVDEEGKLKGLPFNARATAIYWYNTAAHRPALMPPPDEIVGNAILFEGRLP